MDDKVDNLVSLLVICIAVLTIIFIPLRIIGYGFLPPDDALRHAAKVISGKDWSEILVLRPEIKMDSHPGWHAVLGSIHRITGWNQDGLVVFSVVVLFIIFCLVPVFFLEYSEGWLATLLVTNVINTYFIWRLLIGRPFILTVSAVVAFMFLWPKLSGKKMPYPVMLLLTLLITLSTWLHGGCWYLLVLPLGCFLLARQWQAAIRFSICAVLGVLLGASLTGHPFIFLKQNLMQAFLAFSGKPLQRMLVPEFRSFSGDAVTVVVVCLMLLWRAARGAWDPKRLDNPVFILMVCGWILGFTVWRFWLDWGMAAFLVWMAQEFQEVLSSTLNAASLRRVALAIFLAVPLCLSVTSDSSNRCTRNLSIEYLSQDDPRLASWLPAPGGIIYSNEMDVFYQTFFKNPKAPWRYILGFEPTWMPQEDLVIFRKIQWNFSADKAFEPWVKKMRPQDRLIIKRPAGGPPAIEGLKWYYAASDTWIGKLSQ